MVIVKNFVKILFPFQYDPSENIQLESIYFEKSSENKRQLFEKIGFDNAELRKGLVDLFSKEDNKSRIMKGYSFNKNMKDCTDYPHVGVAEFVSREKKDNIYKVNITDINMYLFESGIGFVEIEVQNEKKDSELILHEFIKRNYYMSEINKGDNKFKFKKEIYSEDTGKKYIIKEFTITKMLNSLLACIKTATIFHGAKGIVYSYVLLDEMKGDPCDIFFNMQNNYKSTYKAPRKYNNIKDDPTILQQFDNSYWVTSYNGATNISIKTDDEKTNNFFEKDFFGKMHREYFVLFLAVLHQRYMSLMLMWEMGELDRIEFDYKIMKEQLSKAREYQTKAVNLRFRDFFSFPSYIQHINEYYSLISKTFCVEELYQDLTQDLDNIQRICQMYVDKIKYYESLKQKIKKSVVKAFVTGVSAIIGIVTVVSELWSVLETRFNFPVFSWSVPAILITVVLAIPSLFSVLEIIGNCREIKKEKKEKEIELPKIEKNKESTEGE